MHSFSGLCPSVSLRCQGLLMESLCQNFHIKGTWRTVLFSKPIAKHSFLPLRYIYMQKNSFFGVQFSAC